MQWHFEDEFSKHLETRVLIFTEASLSNAPSLHHSRITQMQRPSLLPTQSTTHELLFPAYGLNFFWPENRVSK